MNLKGMITTVLISIMFVLSCVFGTMAAENNGRIIIGDSNLDGEINIIDATAIQKYVAKYNDSSSFVGTELEATCDENVSTTLSTQLGSLFGSVSFLLDVSKEYATYERTLYFEKSGNDLYYKGINGGVIYVRGEKPNLNIYSSTGKPDTKVNRFLCNSFALENSPSGESNCLKIPHNYSMVYSYSKDMLQLVSNVKLCQNPADYLVIFSVNYGTVSGGIGVDVYNKWTNKYPDIIKINESKKAQAKSFGYRPYQSMDTENNYYNMNLSSNTPQKTELRFIFASDIHGNSKKCARMFSLINDWGTDLIDEFINAGDTVGSANSTTGLDWYKTELSTLGVPSLNTVGNHDAYWEKSGVKGSQSVVNKTFAPTVTDNEAVEQSGKNYYYRDFNNKIRTIVLDCMFWDSEQQSWLINTLNNAVNNNLHVMIVSHAPFAANQITGIECSWTSKMRGYRDGTNTDIQAAEAVRDFKNSGGVFIGWFMGHTHDDEFLELKDEKNYGFQPMLLCASPTMSRSWTSTPLSTDEKQYNYDTFDYVSIDTINQLVKVLKIGADTDYYGVKREALVWNYVTGELITKG